MQCKMSLLFGLVAEGSCLFIYIKIYSTNGNKISSKENCIKLYSLLDSLPYFVCVYIPKQL